MCPRRNSASGKSSGQAPVRRSIPVARSGNSRRWWVRPARVPSPTPERPANGMSTWTSRLTVFGAAVALAGCGAPVDVARLAPETVLVAENVVVAGPPGYCIDAGAVRETGSAAFVLLGSCASLSGDGIRAMPDAPGVLTVLVSPAGGGAVFSAASEQQLQRFFSSDEGRIALSADGRAESVEVPVTCRASGRPASPKTTGARFSTSTAIS